MLRLCPFFCNFHTYVMLRWGGEGWGGMLTFIGTSTSTWCYATARSSATSTQTWCYATACSSATSTHTWCYVGVGWDVNVHWHFHKYVMLRLCPFFCNFHTDVMLRDCLFFCNFQTDVMLRHCLFFCNFHTYGVHQATVLIRLRASWRKKTLRGLSMEKLNPQVRRPLFLHQNWRFAMAKPWICANYLDGKNSAGMFKTLLPAYARSVNVGPPSPNWGPPHPPWFVSTNGPSVHPGATLKCFEDLLIFILQI